MESVTTAGELKKNTILTTVIRTDWNDTCKFSCARPLEKLFTIDRAVHTDWTTKFDGSVWKLKEYASRQHRKFGASALPIGGVYIFSRRFDSYR